MCNLGFGVGFQHYGDDIEAGFLVDIVPSEVGIGGFDDVSLLFEVHFLVWLLEEVVSKGLYLYEYNLIRGFVQGDKVDFDLECEIIALHYAVTLGGKEVCGELFALSAYRFCAFRFCHRVILPFFLLILTFPPMITG